MKKNYYAIIPAFVRYDQNLTPHAKLLYGDISALCNEKGYCFSQNKYFSDLYQVSNVSISKWINQLKNHGYIKVEMIYKKDSKEIDQRKIYLSTPLKKVTHPIKDKFIDNSIIINNNNNVKFNDDLKKAFEHIKNLFPINTQPKTKTEIDNWLSCLDKLERLDGYSTRKVYYVCKKVRSDDFWKDNFLSILKLRKKNNQGIKYIDMFAVKFAKEINKINI